MPRLSAAAFGLYVGLAVCLWYFTRGQQYISDFYVYWSVSSMWWHGQGSAAYTESALRAYTLHWVHREPGRFGWFYPPQYYLLILPLSWLPLYLPAYLPYLIVTLGIFVLVVNRVLKGYPLRWYWLIPSSAFMLNLLRGQNALLTAACLLLSLHLSFRPTLEARGRWGLAAGLIGVSLKPQLGLILPVVMLVRKRYGVALLATFGLVGLVFMASWILGFDVLRAYLGSLGTAREFLETDGHHSGYWHNSASIYALLRLLGASNGTAYGGHAVVAALSLALVVRTVRTQTPARGLVAALIASNLLSPYLMAYDCLSAALAVIPLWEWAEGRLERGLLVLVWQLPTVSLLWTLAGGFPLIPLFHFWLLWRLGTGGYGAKGLEKCSM